MLQEDVRDHVLNQELIAGFALAIFPTHRHVGELFADEVVTPIAERAFRVLHDVAFVDERQGLALVLQCISDRRADQTLGARFADGFDADAGIGAHVPSHFVYEELAEFFRLGRAFLGFQAGIDVLGVFAEDDHIDPFRVQHGTGNVFKVADGAYAGEELELLTQADVEAAEALADRRGEGSLDGHAELADRVDRFVGQVVAGYVFASFTGVDLHPGDFAFAAVTVFDSGVEDVLRRLPDIRSDAVAFNEPNDGTVRRLQGPVVAVGDFFAVGNLNELKAAHRSSLTAVKGRA